MNNYDSPRIVTIPKDIKMNKAEEAFLLCQQLGLIEPEPHGWLFLPEEIKWPGASRSELFLAPPAPEPPAHQ